MLEEEVELAECSMEDLEKNDDFAGVCTESKKIRFINKALDLSLEKSSLFYGLKTPGDHKIDTRK